jgi:inhibitor of KinA sporulation pathway (predicted exonuclease)
MYICVLDFEATCQESGKQNHEIIEFPSVLYKLTDKFTKISEFREYCKPKSNPKLSDFCTKLTGITQDLIDPADTFPNVLARHHKWLTTHIDNFENFTFLTCGGWDWEQFARECKFYNIKAPNVYNKYINIKKDFQKLYKTEKSFGMAGMLYHLKLDLLGRHHCGLDDCRNIGRILEKMIADGYKDFDIIYIKNI